MADSLLMQFTGPMQSWGTQSLYEVRDTSREPSKSGVIGLLCAALGRPRREDTSDLASLVMGIRVDVEGHLEKDYQTIQTLSVHGRVEGTLTSRRYYLAGATFLVGLEGPDTLLAQINHALHHPVWMLSLGRKAFPPSLPIWLPDGLRRGETIESALRGYPWLGRTGPTPARLRLVLEDPRGAESRSDVPLSFAKRSFALRRLHTEFVLTPSTIKEVA